jgi:DNA-directed RNA polymerase subunit K/omega
MEFANHEPDGVEMEPEGAPVVAPVGAPVVAPPEDDHEEETEGYLQKFDQRTKQHLLTQYHPECLAVNDQEVHVLAQVVRDERGVITDAQHRSLPILTKYERARILGERAKQLDAGAVPLVDVPAGVIDGYRIALLELEAKAIPFIIKRPLPNGKCEYWRLADLEVL